MGEVPRLWRLLVLLHTDYKLTVDWGNFPQLDFVAVLQHGDDEVPYFKGVQQKLKQHNTSTCDEAGRRINARR